MCRLKCAGLIGETDDAQAVEMTGERAGRREWIGLYVLPIAA